MILERTSVIVPFQRLWQHESVASRGGTMAKATFGAGCFWGVESAFRQIEGVTDAAVGYMGGTLANPRYEDVCTDRTGHAEVVQLNYDQAQVSYEQLLRVFFDIHDPTTLNRQGADFGKQYRSVIFFHDAEQERAAQKVKEELDGGGRFPRKIVTQIVPAADFWRAEEHHQRYFEKHGIAACGTH
jgi:peptide-methionine (S)-S-oxide reductase